MSKEFVVKLSDAASNEVKQLKAFHQREILDKIEEQLAFEPTRETRNKKLIEGIIPSWGVEGDYWELRIGEYRVFYNVDEKEGLVIIQAIRHKPPHRTIKEIQ